jgi:alpha-mannosidase
MVYEDAEKLYAEVAKDGKELFKEAASAYFNGLIPLTTAIAGQIPLANGRLVALNTIHANRQEVIEIPLSGPSATKLRTEVVQISKDGSKAYALMDSEGNEGGLMFAKGMYADLKPVSGMSLSLPIRIYLTMYNAAVKQAEDVFILTNANISMTIKGGRITSLYDMLLQ